MIEVKEVTKEFRVGWRQRREFGDGRRKLMAVDRASFSCRPGRAFGLIGPNGAGKTTMLRMVATMMRPTSGTITVNGMDAVTRGEEVRRCVGFMTGQTALYDRLTPNEMVKYVADLNGMTSAAFASRRDRLFSILDMEEFAHRRIGRLSTGMKQKTSIARTIIHDPPVLVLDEPTAGLDVLTSRRILDLIRSCREEGKTVLLSTHRMDEVRQVCDDLGLIHKGRIFFTGSKEEFEKSMARPSYEEEFIHRVGEAA